jgi:glycosyltransferase involved in cell wall biosynthesis
MRILHIIQRYWPARGGAEEHLREFSTRLAADGHQVTVATTDALDFELFWDPSRRRVEKREDRDGGVRILRFPVRHLPIPSLSYPAVRRLLWILSACQPVPTDILARISRFTPRVPELWEWLASTTEQFDVVAGMTICFEPLIAAGLRFAQDRGTPFIVYPLTHLGAGAKPGDDALSRFYTMRHQVALIKASSAVAAQTPSEEAFYAEQGVPQDRLLVVGPGVSPEDTAGGDAQRFRNRHGIQGPLIASIGSMAYDKGTIHLIEAVRRLWQSGQQVEIVLAGAILAPFSRYVNRLPAADRARLHILGFVSEEEKRDLLAACDIFALPSRTDSFGIVYLEAWLHEKPVVGARTWGINDVIDDGKDGLLVPFGDVHALTQAVKRLLDQPDEQRAMGMLGRQKVESLHTWDRKYALIKELYEHLSGAKG